MPRGRQKADTLIFNGDLLYQPPFVAEMTNPTGNAWIDGTSTGSLTDDQYRWNMVRDAAGVGFQFDQAKGYNALRVRTTNATGRGRFLYGSNAGTQSQQSVPMLKKYAIPLLPNTDYVLSCDVETLAILFGVARITVNVHDANGLRIVSNTGAGVAGTNTKVPLTNSFNSLATGAFLVFFLELSQAGASDMYAWFSNIKLSPASGLNRTRAEGRTLEGGNRFKIDDYGTAYDLGGTASIVKTGVLDGYAARPLLTFSLNIKQKDLVSTNVGGSQQVIWGTAFGGNSYMYLSLRNSQFHFRYASSAGFDQTATFPQRPNQKLKIGGTFGADGRLRLYINGALVNTSAQGNIANITDITVPDFRVGTISGMAIGNIIVDSIKLWRDVIFTDAEMKALQLNNRMQHKEKCYINWNLNEGTGTVAGDSSGNGNDGTITPGASGTWSSDVFTIPRTRVPIN